MQMLPIALTMLLLVRSATAAPLLDQVFDPRLSGNISGPVEAQFGQFGIDQAQTFTVGRSGQFAGIEILLRSNRTDGIFIALTNTISGVPLEDENAALASVFLPSDSLPTTFFPEYVSVDFTPFDLIVSAGDQLAIVVRVAVRGVDGGSVTTVGNTTGTGDNYLFGSAFSRSSPTWIQACSFGDCTDTANFVDWGFKTFIVPEPGTALLLGLGLAGLVAMKRGA